MTKKKQSKIQKIDLETKIIDIDYNDSSKNNTDLGLLNIDLKVVADFNFLCKLVGFLEEEEDKRLNHIIYESEQSDNSG